jgi:hypothetical protein
VSDINGVNWLGRASVVVDSVMVVALLSLSYWVGTQAAQLQTLSGQMGTLQAKADLASTNAEAAALKVASQDRALLDMRDYLGQRLDRIERKLDEDQLDGRRK